MIIVYIMGGIGNQLWQYAAGRRLAHKWNTELKLDTTYYDHDNLRPYALNLFNITANIATPEEIARIKSSENSEGGANLKNRINSCRKSWITPIMFGFMDIGNMKNISRTLPTFFAKSSR